MTEQERNRRTRRRFLADMLFLGGGVTAAALIAKNQTGSPPVDHPPLAGAVAPPQDPNAFKTPCPTPARTPESPPPLPGEPMPPEVEGEFVLPEDPPPPPPDIKGDVAPPQPPKTGGKPMAPQPEENGR